MKNKSKRDWNHYNRALINRGNIFLWFEESTLSNWKSLEKTGKRGRPRYYSNSTIELILTLKCIFKFPLRQIQGLVCSLTKLLNLDLEIPDYTTLSRRQKNCHVTIPKQASDKNIHLVLDSTGLKVFGEGEWKVRSHGIGKRRTWRKVHLGIDESTGQIEAVALTTNDFKNSELTQDLVEQVSIPIKKISADSGYDAFYVYDYLKDKKIKPLIPPRKDAKIRQHKNYKNPVISRDQVLRDIRKLGLKNWKKFTGYHRRNLAEITMYRLKQLTGERLAARNFEQQWVEVKIRCKILNQLNTKTFLAN